MKKITNYKLPSYDDRSACYARGLQITNQAGFTVIEILVVASLIAFTTGVVIRNFVGSRLNLERVANVMASDIRLAQQLALSSHQYKGTGDPAPRNRCGYGIVNQPYSGNPPDNERTYLIYAGPPTVKPDGTPGTCGSTKYQQNQDFPYYQATILDKRLEFATKFKDIFYAPPNPITYINDATSPSDLADSTTYYEKIYINKVGINKSTCDGGSPDCIFICVYFSGRIEVSKSPTCPAPF